MKNKVFPILLNICAFVLFAFCFTKYLLRTIDSVVWYLRYCISYGDIFNGWLYNILVDFLPCVVSVVACTYVILFFVKGTNFLNFAKFSYEEYKTKKLENRERKKQERIKKAEAKLSKLKED